MAVVEREVDGCTMSLDEEMKGTCWDWMEMEKIKPRDKAKESGDAIFWEGKNYKENKQSKSGGGT